MINISEILGIELTEMQLAKIDKEVALHYLNESLSYKRISEFRFDTAKHIIKVQNEIIKLQENDKH